MDVRIRVAITHREIDFYIICRVFLWRLVFTCVLSAGKGKFKVIKKAGEDPLKFV